MAKVLDLKKYYKIKQVNSSVILKFFNLRITDISCFNQSFGNYVFFFNYFLKICTRIRKNSDGLI